MASASGAATPRAPARRQRVVHKQSHRPDTEARRMADGAKDATRVTAPPQDATHAAMARTHSNPQPMRNRG